MSKDYIDIPLNEEQISKVIEYRDYISEFTYDYWFAGSFVLSLFLDDKIDPPNDLDIFINSKKSPIEIFEEFQNKDKSFRYHRMSKFAVTVKRNGWLPLQLIPVSCSGIEELLDTFDLTLASIGIFSDNEGVFFKVHTDILTTHFGLPPKGKFRNSSENKNLHIIKRAMKYAKKFHLEVDRVFTDFHSLLYSVEPKLLEDFDRDRHKFFHDFEELQGIDSGNYEDNELLQQLLHGARRGNRGFEVLARPFGEPVMLFGDNNQGAHVHVPLNHHRDAQIRRGAPVRQRWGAGDFIGDFEGLE